MRRALLLAAVLCVLIPGLVLAASTTWKLYSFNASGRALRAQVVAFDAGTGTVSFTFPETPDAAYLTSTKVGNLGDLTGQILEARVSITAESGTTYAAYPDQCNPSGAEPKVGLYFQTKSTGGFDPSTFWWSSDRHLLTTIVENPTVLSTPLTVGSWTNYNGQTDPAGFAAAVANVVAWGVSFGGGCHYANGVGTPIGSADFFLTTP